MTSTDKRTDDALTGSAVEIVGVAIGWTGAATVSRRAGTRRHRQGREKTKRAQIEADACRRRRNSSDSCV